MIKTLRITSIIMVVVAAVLLVFPVLFGVRGNKDIEQFLASDGAIEKFKESADSKAKNGENQTSPLVKQAEAFTLFLNPPKPVEMPEDSQPDGIPRPQIIISKFKLIGTSYFAAHPELSLALIDEPGEGVHWVRQADEVGHLLIEQVKDGIVVVKDGQKTFEIASEKQEKTNPLIKDSSAPAAASVPAPVLAADKKPAAATAAPSTGVVWLPENRKAKGTRRASPVVDSKSKALGMALITKNRDKVTDDLSEGEKKLADKVFAELDAMKVSTTEANKLGALGEDLKNAGTADPNKYHRKIDKPKRPRRGPTPPTASSPSTPSTPSTPSAP